MGKNNKNNKPAAPAAEAKTTTPEVINVLDMNQFVEKVGTVSQEGLDPNHRVDLLRIMHETFRQDPDAAEKYHMPKDTVVKINEITAAGMVAALACEVTFGKNPFAITMQKSQLDTMAEVGAAMGITFNLKALPAPNVNGEVEVPSTEIKVSKEAKTAMKEEEEIKAKDVEIDPTKISNTEELVEAIKAIMIKSVGGFEKIDDAVSLYISWLKLQAKDNKDELDKINSMSRIEAFNQMRALVGRCPFVLNGMGRFMATITRQTKSPISAFCKFKNATKNRKTGETSVDDTTIAAYVRAVIEWVVEVDIAAQQSIIDTCKENIKELSKNKKQNATAIESEQKKIEEGEKRIEHYNSTLIYITDPSSEVVDNLLKNRIEKEKEACRIFQTVAEYIGYDKEVMETGDPAAISHNVQQHAGIITNLFRDPATPILEYSAANLVSIEREDDSKN